MAGKTFKSIEELEKYIEQQATEILATEGLKEVRKTMQKNVETEVYSKYTPNNGEPYRYERRKTNGGLQDEQNIVVTNKRSDGVDIENITTGTRGYRLDEVIESGKGYEYTYNRDGANPPYTKPRRFVNKTYEDLRDSDAIADVLEKGLKNKGIDVSKK